MKQLSTCKRNKWSSIGMMRIKFLDKLFWWPMNIQLKVKIPYFAQWNLKINQWFSDLKYSTWKWRKKVKKYIVSPFFVLKFQIPPDISVSIKESLFTAQLMGCFLRISNQSIGVPNVKVSIGVFLLIKKMKISNFYCIRGAAFRMQIKFRENALLSS